MPMLGLSLSICSSGRAADVQPFDATSIAGLLAWYPARKATQSGGAVSALADQSGTGDSTKNLPAIGTVAYNAADAAYGNRTTMQMAGAGRLEGSGPWAVAPTLPLTIYAVGDIQNGNGRLFDGGPIGGRCIIMRMNASLEWSLYNGTTWITSSGLDARIPAVVCGVFDTTDALYVNDPVTPAATGDAGNQVIDRLVLGSLGGTLTGALAGKFGEGIVFAGAHNATLRSTVMSQLRAYYKTP